MWASNQTIILPPQVIAMLKEYRQAIESKWLFPSPVKDEDVPRDPTACRKRLSSILEHAGCKHVPFHALRHTFASHSFHYGMDVKTLASTIGHESVETTLNVYAHATDEMKQTAARKIERTMGSAVSGKSTCEEPNNENEQRDTVRPKKPQRVKFEPYKGKKRKPGTGCISQISESLWEGRYTPTVNGKRIARNVYAHSLEECEEKLEEMIKEMKKEIAEGRLTA